MRVCDGDISLEVSADGEAEQAAIRVGRGISVIAIGVGLWLWLARIAAPLGVMMVFAVTVLAWL